MDWLKTEGGIFLPRYLQPGVGEIDLLNSEIFRREPWTDDSLNQACNGLIQRHSGLHWLVWLRSHLGIKLADYLNDGFETHLSAVEITCSSTASDTPSSTQSCEQWPVRVAPKEGVELLATLFVMRRRRVERLLHDFDVKVTFLPDSWKVFNQRSERSSMLSFRSIGPLLHPCDQNTPEAWIVPWTARRGPPTAFELLPADFSGLKTAPKPIACAQLVGDIMYLSRCMYNLLRSDKLHQHRAQFRRTGCVFVRSELLRNAHNRGIEGRIKEAIPTWSFDCSASFLSRLQRTGICRTEEGATVFDLFYGTSRLQETLEQELVTMDDEWRSKRFADSVQNYLDQSPWNPGQYKVLRGQTPLKDDGQPLTDLDAVGVKAGHLLICECKAVSCGMLRRNPVKAQWNNAKCAVEEYTQAWVAKLKKNTMFTSFGGVSFSVVTPLPFPLHPKYLEHDEFGFPRTCSIDELAEKIGVQTPVAYFSNVPPQGLESNEQANWLSKPSAQDETT